MEVKGLLIGVRRYQFSDKETGDLISGVKISLGIESEDDNVVGYRIQDISAKFESFKDLADSAKDLSGKFVSVFCHVNLNGRYTKLQAYDIQAAV